MKIGYLEGIINDDISIEYHAYDYPRFFYINSTGFAHIYTNKSIIANDIYHWIQNEG